MDKKEKTGVLNVRDLVNVGLFSVDRKSVV